MPVNSLNPEAKTLKSAGTGSDADMLWGGGDQGFESLLAFQKCIDTAVGAIGVIKFGFGPPCSTYVCFACAHIKP